MENPILPVSPISTPNILPTLAPLPNNPLPTVTPVAQTNTLPTLQPLTSMPIPTEEPISPLPVVTPVSQINPVPTLQPQGSMSASTLQPLDSMQGSNLPIVKNPGKKKLIILILALLLFIIAVIIAAFLLLSKSNQPIVNIIPIVSSPVPASTQTTVSSPTTPQAEVETRTLYSGRLYTLDFDYSSNLGQAVGTTSKLTYPSSPEVNGDCNTEAISFSKDSSFSIGVSTGHCEGGSGGSPDYTKITSKDGKSFFIIVSKLDDNLFPGMYSIIATGGVDSTNTFVAGITGVRINAIRVTDVEKYKKYIEDIINSMSVQLSPLKSEDFDSQSNI